MKENLIDFKDIKFPFNIRNTQNVEKKKTDQH